MNFILNSNEMKHCDSSTISHFGIPSLVLMEKAALAVAEEIKNRFGMDKRILIVCGSGNNGGDGFAIGRILYVEGYPVSLYFAGKKEKCTVETLTQMQICETYGLPFAATLEEESYDVIVDALFGNGLVRELQGDYAKLVADLNGMAGFKLAVDLPSGISADSGAVMGCAFRADLTVAVAYKKLGHLFYPGAEYSGEVITKDIGISEKSWLGLKPSVFELTAKDLKNLPKRAARSNKGTFGKVLLAAGSKGMAGAAILSAKAAYRSGCGLVKVFTSEQNRQILQQAVPEAVLCTYEEGNMDPSALAEGLFWADVVAVGPGLGTGKTAHEIVETIVSSSPVPTILDADALNIISENMELLERPHADLAITPHVGEMARLAGKSTRQVKENILDIAREFADKYGLACLLKDARSVCALPDGTAYIVTSGNSGMATAGSGDVLTGVIAGIAGSGMDLKHAVPYGAYIHGLAGASMAARTGEAALMAGDLMDGLQDVWKRIEYEVKSQEVK